ncbi:MAG: di/tricarboxylate transporter [Psychromonas sp.]
MQQPNLPAEPFVLAVLLRQSMSYTTPMAYKTHLLVMIPGGYTFNDFLKIEIPLTIIMWGLSWILTIRYDL